MSQRRLGGLTISVAELLLTVTLAALGTAALKLGGLLAALLLTAAAVLYMAAIIQAFVERGGHQSQAIAFALCSTAYAAVVFWAPGNQMDPHGFRSLPTSQLLRPVFDAFVRRTWVDAATGKELKDYDPAKTEASRRGGGYGGGYGGYGSGPVLKQIPDSSTFMTVGHVLWALLLSYVAAKYAGYIDHRRRVRQAELEQGDVP